jgi:hypothetical protein
VKYSIRQASFKRLFYELQQRGFEVALHASYNAYQSGFRFIWERTKLKSVSYSRVKGIRHHYAHLGDNKDATFLRQEVAGIEYDSSIFFSDMAAFRRSIALPYYIWNDKLSRELRVQEFPVFCVDGNLFHYNNMDYDSSLTKLVEITHRIKSEGGIGVLNWHEDTSHYAHPRFGEWGRCYFSYLEFLALDSDAWVTSIENIAMWLAKRRQWLEVKD